MDGKSSKRGLPPSKQGSPAASRAAPRIALEEAVESGQVTAVAELLRPYARSLSTSHSAQDLAAELAGLPGDYAPPRGRLLLGRVDGRAEGCVALRPLEPRVCEMKRLYVRPEARGTGLGGRLVRRAIADAAALGYERMRLDTLPEMETALNLYRRLGFRPIASYNANPIPGALFFELDLRAGAPGV